MAESIIVFGREISLYYLFWFIGAVSVLLIGCWLGKHYKFSSSRSIIYVTGAILLGYLLLWCTSWISGFGRMNGLNFVRIVIFMPIPVYLLSKLFTDSFWSISDYVAPLLALFHGITHIGCIFPGCCHGYAYAWGLYSNEVKQICFPIQPIEAISSILIGIVLLGMAIKNKQTKRLYPWYLTLYGGTRFIWEFFRDNTKIWNGISELAFYALVAFVIGIASLVIMKWVRRKGCGCEKN